jgi:hypothetical protein
VTIRRKMTVAAWLLIIAAPPAYAAGPQCVEMPVGRTLEAEAKAGRPTSEIVEALLRDAETIHCEGSRIVNRKPRTEAESFALFEKNFLIGECHFQKAFTLASKAEVEDRLQWTLTRIEQFDNFIFGAVTHAVSCSNTEAGRRLKVSRELLDHAWMEFKGDIRERDWDPKLDWPDTHESCSR